MSKRPTRSHFGAGQKAAVEVLTLAAGFAAAVAVFWLVGRTIDNRVGSEPWGQVAGALVGWVLGFLHVYYGARRIKG